MVFLLWQIVVPLIGIVYTSFKDVRPDDPTFLSPDFSLTNINEIFSGDLLAVVLRTTVFAVGSSLIALILGGFLAFVTTRTNAVCRGIIAALVLYQLAMPEVLYPIVWSYLLSPDNGVINEAWQSLTGTEGVLLNAYGMPAMILVESFLLLPLVYLFMVPGLTAMDRSLEEAAEVSGAGRSRVMRDIVFKLAMPAIVATGIIALMRSWEAFEVPWYLGLREKNLTYSTELFFQTVTPPSDTGRISAYALPMLAVALLMVWYYSRFNRAARRYATMSGKNFRPEPIRLKPVVRWVVGLGSLAVLFVGVILPILMLVWLSLMPFYRPPSLKALDYASIDSYTRLFADDAILIGFRNSLIVGLGTTLLVLVVASLSGWFVVHERRPSSKLLDFLTFVPLSFPNIVIAICMLWLYLMLPIDIRGTYVSLVLAFFILFVALAARNINARLMQINRELHEAAVVSGASFLTSFRTVVMPLLGPALLASGLYITVWAFKELEASILLSDPSTKTATVVIYDKSGLATTAEVAAIGVVSLTAILFVVIGFQIVARKYKLVGF
ncbi:hypothetical protein ASJ79_15995 [Mycobacterium sp. NAZ190054]|nr:hypothetical protein ASJ79_15995 [Mycobacterium sp. NAZ190054]